MNKRGALVLRDVMFMLLIGTIVVVLASVFIDDMSRSYDNPNNMSTEFQASPVYLISNESFFSTSDDLVNMTEDVDGGLWEMAKGTLEAVPVIVQAVLFAPSTFGDIIADVLIQIGTPTVLANMVAIFIKSLIYGLIVFVIITAFLRGGKV